MVKFIKGQKIPRLVTKSTPQHRGVEYRDCEVEAVWNGDRYALLQARKAYGRIFRDLRLHIGGFVVLEPTKLMQRKTRAVERVKVNELEKKMRINHLNKNDHWVRPNGSIVSIVCRTGKENVGLICFKPKEGAKRKSMVAIKTLIKPGSAYRPVSDEFDEFYVVTKSTYHSN